MYLNKQEIEIIQNLYSVLWFNLPILITYLTWGFWQEEPTFIGLNINKAKVRYIEEIKVFYLEHKKDISNKLKKRLLLLEQDSHKTIEIKDYKKVYKDA